MSTSPTSPEDHKLQFGKSRLMVIFCIFYVWKKKMFKETLQTFQCLHASLSSIVSTWNHSDMMTTKFTLGTLLHWRCNQMLTRTTQVSGNCGLGYISSVFMSKVSTFCTIARIKGIDVSTYFYTSGVRTDYPSGAVEFTPVSCVELVFLNL
jgi:hypothetical protein